MSGSCVGCKFLYSEGTGYSNWTWMSDDIHCALDKNPNLPSERPSDWEKVEDNWPRTMNSRCDSYDEGVFVELDVDGETKVSDETNDEEQIEAICKHSGYER